MPDDATPRFTRKGRATHARIVDVAAKLMFKRGIAGTSIDEVRNTAAVSGSQISHYFHDKRDLTRQVISARRDDVRQFHSQPELGALDSLEALQAWADANVADINAVYRKGGCVYGSLAGELVEADAEIHGDLRLVTLGIRVHRAQGKTNQRDNLHWRVVQDGIGQFHLRAIHAYRAKQFLARLGAESLDVRAFRLRRK